MNPAQRMFARAEFQPTMREMMEFRPNALRREIPAALPEHAPAGARLCRESSEVVQPGTAGARVASRFFENEV